MNRKWLTASLMTVALALPLAAQEKNEIRKRVFVGGEGLEIIDGSDGPAVFLLGKGGYLGISTSNLSPELREHFGATRQAGVLVGKIFEDTPAARAGLRVGDVITSIDGEPVDSSWNISRALREKKKGDQVRIEFIRDGAPQSAIAEVDERSGPASWSFNDMEFPREELEIALKELPRVFGPEGRVRMLDASECEGMRDRLRDLESRLKDLEKRLQK